MVPRLCAAKRSALWLAGGLVVPVGIGLFVFLASSRPTSIGEVDSSLSQGQELRRGSNGSGAYYLNANKTGIFYIDNNLMYYLDYASEETYVLCDRADCKHNDADCGAYLEGGFGFCAVDEQLYAFVTDQEKNSYNLIRMDRNGQNRRVVCSISCGEETVGNYVLNDFQSSDIYYGYGRVYITLTYRIVKPPTAVSQNGLCKKQVCVIDLATGKMETLFEAEGVDLFLDVEIQAIAEECMVITMSQDADGLVAETYDEALSSGLSDELVEMLEALPPDQRLELWENDLYSFYLGYAIYQMDQCQFSAYLYDFSTDQITQIWDEACGWHYSDTGLPDAWVDPFYCAGWFEGDLLLCFCRYEAGSEPQTTVRRYDLQSGELHQVVDLSAGSLVMYAFGTVGNYVVDDGKLIYIRYLPDGNNGQLCSYDLKDNTETMLYEDVRTVTFRFLGEYQDNFIGDMMVNSRHGVYRISKADYYAGHLEQAKLLLSV